VTVTPAQVRAAVGDVLEDPVYALAAEAVRAEVAALPGPERAVEELERLVRSGS
jgi:UDP:flavonoid glycosyltransferase YjiC (YdhE family)